MITKLRVCYNVVIIPIDDVQNTKVEKEYPRGLVGSFSNDDSDGNEDVKKAIGLFITQNNNFTRASRCFVHFFTVLARLRRENS